MLRTSLIRCGTTSTAAFRSTPLRLCPAATSSPTPSPSLVSFAQAPGLSQAPLDTIGLPPKDVPPYLIQAYVFPEVITPSEEDALIRFSSRWFDRIPFAANHCDNLIHRYKEFYRPFEEMMIDDRLLCVHRSQQHQQQQQVEGETANRKSEQMSEGNKPNHQQQLSEETLELSRSALRKARAIAGTHLKHIPLQNRVHFLQLHGDGFIRAHVDESRNSSGIVAGLTLGSGRVMTLTHPTQFPGAKVDLCLRPRSFYVLTGTARYEWEHSVDWVAEEETAESKQGVRVVEGSEVYFAGQPTGMLRAMRTAVIFRGVSPMELLMSRMKLPHRHA